MAWKVALVLDEVYSAGDLAMLVHQMPVWAIVISERRDAAASIRQGAGELWAPEPAFTLFIPDSTTDKEETCRCILATLLEHHSQLALLDLIGIPASERLTEILQAAGFESAEGSVHEGLPFRKPIERLQNVRELILDARHWQTADDLYNSFFEAVGAPAWHGRNFDALRDSIVTGEINRVEVPYRVHIRNYTQLGFAARQMAGQFVSLIQRFEREGCPVSVQVDE